MSTFEQRVSVIENFLKTRARLRRVTTLHEVGVVAGKKLASYRANGSTEPVDKVKVRSALRAIAQKSFQDKGHMLSAVVVHFNDNNPSRRFFEVAGELGITGSNVHRDQLNKVFDHYDPQPLASVDLDDDEPDDEDDPWGEDEDEADDEPATPEVDAAGDRNDDPITTPW